MSTSAESNLHHPRDLKRIVIGAMIGTVAEWYDFLIYAAAATVAFGKIFFPPSSDPMSGVIGALLIYAVGFIARPLGAIVFGYLGDRYGRKPMLQWSILITGIATFAIGCLPTIATAGYWAPGLLVVCRLVQGFAAGGEWGGAVLIVAEHAPDNRRASWTSWPQAALPLGNLLATLVLGLLSAALPGDDFLSWGWRCAFWLAAVIALVGAYIRKNVEDAPIAKELLMKEERGRDERPKITDIFRQHPRALIVAMGLRLTENIFYQVVVTFTITYLLYKHASNVNTILSLMMVANVIHFAIVPLVGRLSDKLGRKPVFLSGAALVIVWSFVSFPAMESGSTILIFISIVLGLAVDSLMYAPYSAMLPEMFPTRVRYLGVSFANQLTSIVAGGLAPFICATLLRSYGTYVPIAIYLTGAASISFIAALAYRETRGVSLRSIDRADELARANETRQSDTGRLVSSGTDSR
ncbi:MFS transporter [Paraburkholderia sabiae]|uniref:MFS transporter n=1 Tax=Paraburkholderia sabiae TaxID=273251 RepID=A0ABU9QHV2_9BURK|nr:MFS transporter [Paraburkholderia sabiae]WJZ77412.1 MFS transporter [Paraburkholderia sabiae]CAD6557712.1 Fosfomycin resistance protein AbaF [Paraburkholderia sabiae]